MSFKVKWELLIILTNQYNIDSPYSKRSIESLGHFEDYMKLNYNKDEDSHVHIEPPDSNVALDDGSPVVSGNNVTVTIQTSDEFNDVKCGLSDTLLQDCNKFTVNVFFGTLLLCFNLM